MSDTRSLPHLSIVSPVYQGEHLIARLVEMLEQSLAKLACSYEIVLVDDGSPDGSWSVMRRLAAERPHVRCFRLSRNFGQHPAITAGLDLARGQWVVVMDCDLQDRPEEVPRLYQKAQEGYDVVLARRAQRHDPWLVKLYSRLFYGVLAYLTGTPQDPSVANFGIYSRKVIDAVRKMREPIRFFPAMVQWVGFRQTTLDVVHSERSDGVSGYNCRKRLMLAMDIILAYSNKPLRLMIQLGFLVAASSFLWGVYILVLWLQGHITVLGYASQILSIWFLGGLIIMLLGMVGLYVGKIFEGVKHRPLYILDEETES